MLYVHKESRGVLQAANRPPGLSPVEWWEVRERTALGRKILRYYPCFDAVTNEDGALRDGRRDHSAQARHPLGQASDQAPGSGRACGSQAGLAAPPR